MSEGGAAPESAGKANRVTGVFVFMMGAGMILDVHAMWVGVPLSIVGAVTFAWGLLQIRIEEAATPAACPRLEETESRP